MLTSNWTTDFFGESAPVVPVMNRTVFVSFVALSVEPVDADLTGREAGGDLASTASWSFVYVPAGRSALVLVDAVGATIESPLMFTLIGVATLFT